MSTTFQDSIDHLVDYLGGTPTDAVQRDARRAILEAYRDLTNAFRWSYLLRQGRIVTSMPVTDGTIAYDAATRRLTLTPAAASPVQAWPDWSVGGYVRVGWVAAKCVRRASDTVLVLDDQVGFAADLPALTPFKFYRDSYLLPIDFVAADQALHEQNFGGMSYVHPREWLFEERFVFAEGTPQCYTVTGDVLYPGRLLLRITPLPSEMKTIDFLYHRRPRPLTASLVNAGTVSVASAGTTVTGVGSALTASLVGSVLRLSTDATTAPTGVVGRNPAAFETRITSVTSPTSAEVADAAPAAFSGVAFTVSDPVDVEEGGMLNAFFRCCEMHLSMNRTLKDKPSAALQYQAALNEARAADSRSFAGRTVGDPGHFRQRLRDMPIVFNTT